MSAQQALAVIYFGEHLEKVARIIPTPGENQVLVKVTVAGLNPSDQKARDYDIFQWSHRLPAVIGSDVVGSVVAAGPGSHHGDLPPGTRVMTESNLHGTNDETALQEYVVADVPFTARVPDNLSDADAAVFPTNGVTAAVALFDESGLKIPFPSTPASASFDYKSQTLLIMGGGNVSKLATQFAKVAGIGTIIVIAGSYHAVELRAYGATHVIDRKLSDEEIFSKVREIVGDDLIYAFDAVGAPNTVNLAVSLLSDSKKGSLAKVLPTPPDAAIAQKKSNGFDDLMVFGSSHAHPEVGALFWKALPTWIEKGLVKPLRYAVVQGLDVDKVNLILNDMRDDKNKSRWHVRI
ncbi:GroES-like protein [Xylona heveae TC161]|uniref:GroES-like protein n=1 Tax=Xylona heveae (strain CBS 132557 / TC161) TaxID=1328760 RepID=A0A165AC35_XYLHT|nr:GroES-like protein [Xylona heveae TC161]KZF20235.1 GroES-like protein [Xylona heveae TC161]